MKGPRQIRWAAEYAAYRLVEGVFSILPLPLLSRAGSALGRIAWRLMRRQRAIVIKNLRVAFASEMTIGEIRPLAREIFECTGANFFGALKTARLSPDALRKIISMKNFEVIEKAVRNGKGVILLVPHMGNWEALAQFTSLLPEGSIGGTHYRPLNNIFLNSLIERRRQQQRLRLFKKRSSPHTLAAFLKENGVLGILADQRANRGGYNASYYGRFSQSSSLPEILARRTGATILALSMKTTAPGQWSITFHHLREPDTPGCMMALEEATRISPRDVFWFQDRWKLRGDDPYRPEGKPHPRADPGDSGKPYRVGYFPELPTLPDDPRPDLRFEKLPEKVFAGDTSPRELEELLETISLGQDLPLNAIVHHNPGKALRRACRKLAIQIIP